MMKKKWSIAQMREVWEVRLLQIAIIINTLLLPVEGNCLRSRKKKIIIVWISYEYRSVN